MKVKKKNEPKKVKVKVVKYEMIQIGIFVGRALVKFPEGDTIWVQTTRHYNKGDTMELYETAK